MISAQKVLVWLARLISSVAAVFFLFFAISEGGLKILKTEGEIRLKTILFATFLIFTVTSTIIAFWRVNAGAYLLFISGLFLGIFIFIIATQNNLLIALTMGGPFILAAILLCLSMREKRSREIIKID